MGTSEFAAYVARTGKRDPMQSRPSPQGALVPQGYPLWCAVRRPGAAPVVGPVVAWVTREQGISRADPMVAFPPYDDRTASSVIVVDLEATKTYFADSRADALAAAGG